MADKPKKDNSYIMFPKVPERGVTRYYGPLGLAMHAIKIKNEDLKWHTNGKKRQS